MIKFTNTEQAFIDKYELTQYGEIMDVRGMIIREYKPIMKSKDLRVAISTPCIHCDMRLKDRHGKCLTIACNNQALGRIVRSAKSSSTMYIATSPSLPGIVKVGWTGGNEPKKRIYSLNERNYGGANNWEFAKTYNINSSDGEALEAKVHSHLKSFNAGNKDHQELFACEMVTADMIIKVALR